MDTTDETTPMSDTEFLAMIEGAPDLPDATGYEDAANATAKTILFYLRAHPEHADVDFWNIPPDLDAQLHGHGLTGVQVGWALNAAKHILGRPPVANPAILTIGTDD